MHGTNVSEVYSTRASLTQRTPSLRASSLFPPRPRKQSLLRIQQVGNGYAGDFPTAGLRERYIIQMVASGGALTHKSDTVE